MTFKELDKESNAKLKKVYEGLIPIYQEKLKKLNFKVGDYVKRNHAKDHSYAGEDSFDVFCLTKVEINERLEWEEVYTAPRVEVWGQKCTISKKHFKSCFRLENIDEFEHYEYVPQVKIKSAKPTYVYLIEAGEVYKIGFSNNPEKRLFGIQTSNPNVCKMLFKIKDPFGTLEKDLHSKFNKFRLQGEWFLKEPLILEEFKKLSTNEHQRESINLFTQTLSA